MPVYEAAYRKWERGAGAGRGSPTLAILAVMAARVLRLRFVKLLLLVTVSCACFFSFLVFYVSYDAILEQVRRRMGLEGFNMLHFVNQQFLIPIRPVAMLLAAIVGTPLIAEDRRARALALYFSRPITHVHYVAGKFLTVALFLALLVLLPPVCFYFVEVLLSPNEDVVAAQLPALLRSLVPGLVLVAMFASMSLGVSSLLRRTTYAGLAFLGTVMLAWAGAEALAASLRDPSWYALSPLSVVVRIGSDLLPIPELGGRMSFPHFRLRQMDPALAWLGAAAWTAGGLAILSWRVRNVEVVS
jgi:ABC-type transport system involved in multi-copper enzyme maturation permease subunit